MTACVVSRRRRLSWVIRQKTEMRVLTQAGKPTSGDDVVEMPLGGEGDPDVDVREKE